MSEPVRILVVDDDPDILRGTARLLEKAGYTVDRAASGEEALLAAQNHRPDLLLLDHDLPGINGTEVCRQIKQDPALADTLVVIVSALRAESGQQAEGLELGADGYIGRPIGNRELLARVQAYVRIQRLTRSLRLQAEELQQSNEAANQAHLATRRLMADAVAARERLEIANQALQSENTARKLAEEALREKGIQFRSLFEQAGQGILIVGREGRIVEANKMAAAMHGFTSDEFTSMGLTDLDTPESAALMPERMRRVFAGETLHFEVTRRHKDGHIFPMSVTASLFTYAGVPYVIGFFTDITARRQAEAALRESHGMIVKLTSQVPGVVYQYRLYPDGRSAFPFASPGMNDIYEVTPEEVREDATPVFGRLHPDDYDRIVADIQESARTLQPFHCEFRVVLPRQGLRWRLSDASPERMADGSTLWHGIISDITARRQAEAALRESEGKLRSVIDCSPVPLAVNDEQGNITYVNREFTKTFGYELGDIPTLAAWWQKAYPDPAYQAKVKTQWQLRLNQALQEGKAFEPVEVNIRCQNGAQRIAMVGAAALPGTFTGTHLVVLYDITERKQVEAALQKFVMLADSSSEFIGMCDLALQPLYVNPAGLRMVGLPDMAAACRVKVQDCFFPEDQQFIAEEFFPSVLREGHGDVEIRLRHFQSGEPIWMFYYLFRVRDASGEIVGWATVSRDITERKRAEEADERARRRLNEAQRIGRIGDWEFDLATQVITWSPQVFEILGRDPKLGPPRDLAEAAAMYDAASKTLLEEKVARAIESGEPQDYELLARRPDGGRVHVQARAVPRKDDRGMVLGLLGTVQDITDRKRAEAEIRELNRSLEQRVQERTAELRAANQELEAFAYAVSHDLRQPLRAMNGFSRALLEDHGATLPGEACGHLDEIILASRRMGELIDGLLRLSRSTRGELRHDALDLSALASRILGELAAAEPNRRVMWTVEPGLTARGDERMIEVALANLLGNAWKYTASTPQPEIEVGMVGKGEDFGAAPSQPAPVFFVRDNGAGFDMNHAAKLFQPFQRLHREDEFPGIGIGLATVQRIVHRHGGAIRATAAPGAGATFCFSLSFEGGNDAKEP
jgi:PAS domain S-box-containing protein